MRVDALSEFVVAAAEEVRMPGVAVGVWANGQEAYACHGVTSLENPVPVDRDTAFLLGSVTKTYTATALMCLVADGQVELTAPVRHYLPELRLADEQATADVTVLNLLNHTSGLDWGLIADTGEGDDALARYVNRLGELDQITPPGRRASFSQAGFNMAGRILEKVTGLSYERAVASLLFEPLGLAHSFFARDDIMTRRFSVGHNLGQDDRMHVVRLWRRARGDNPGGGLAASVADQVRWAAFHLGDGYVNGSGRVLPREVLAQMREPTAALRGSTLGDAIGLGWFLRDIDGVRTAGHGGTANGQFAELLTAPDEEFAVVSLANAGPDGLAFNQTVVRWALRSYLGVTERDPEPLPYDEARTREILGSYENDAMTIRIGAESGRLWLAALLRPGLGAAVEKDLPPDHAPFDVGLLPGDADEYVITRGALRGQRGFFTRAPCGSVVGIDLGGRLFSRVATEEG
ncbi:MAG TPA: serine hydrolase domain-containing protein [Solirubrobacteraceae bacterium]|jgi:CubicO group peptidase (beta-lactamase class C family)|nr:serine hydrolase domain-containing protein [Solirubrobacteraceae bacterium]